MAEEESRAVMERAFRLYGCPLDNVVAFKYLGHILTATDDDWTAIVFNLQKSQKNWAKIAGILG